MWLASETVKTAGLVVGKSRRVVVGLPARDEAGSIGDCLRALDSAAARFGGPVTIVVGANNCSDDTACVARRFKAKAATIVVEDVLLPPRLAHAGGARRHVMDRAAALAGSGGVVMTTDADSCVDTGWIAANVGEIVNGADAVAGMITFDAAARAELPMLAGRAAEWRLATLHARLEHLIDPRPHDPWPRHIWAWGASLALTVETYRAVGGVPLVALAEDRALADAVEYCGFRLRRSYAPMVYTSPRQSGRAPGGFADLIAAYASDAATPCDAALEPTRTLWLRLRTRARLRGESGEAFRAAWGRIEAATPALARKRLRPGDLAAEIACAERLIKALEQRAARRADNRPAALAA